LCNTTSALFGEPLDARFLDMKKKDLADCDTLIVIGTSLVVYPFAGLVNEVSATTPRLLINKESAGVFRRVTGEEDAPAIGNYRDVVFLGESDQGVAKLAELLNWEEDLKLLSEKPSELLNAVTKGMI
jgi:NAD-dependent SIR2 family protein deacetylase